LVVEVVGEGKVVELANLVGMVVAVEVVEVDGVEEIDLDLNKTQLHS
jgi:hypothetical protein